MSDSHFVVQTSKFLLINATAVALGQGHGKFIQYIFARAILVHEPVGLVGTILGE